MSKFRVWQTDGRPDRRTDGRAAFSSLYRVCMHSMQRGKNEKKIKLIRNRAIIVIIGIIIIINAKITATMSQRNAL